MKLKNNRFLVIGGAGFIGSHTIEYLMKNDVKEVVVFDYFFRGKKENLLSSLNSKKVKIIEHGGDILQNDILENSLIGIDGVFHLQLFGYFNVMSIQNQHLKQMFWAHLMY